MAKTLTVYAGVEIELLHQDLTLRPDSKRHEVVALVAGHEVAQRRGESKDATLSAVTCDAKLFIEWEGNVDTPLYLPLSLAQPGGAVYAAITRIVATEGGGDEDYRRLRRWWELRLAERTPNLDIAPEAVLAEVAAHFGLASLRQLIDGSEEAARHSRLVVGYILMRWLKMSSLQVASLLERSTANVGTNLRSRCEGDAKLLTVAEQIWADILKRQTEAEAEVKDGRE